MEPFMPASAWPGMEQMNVTPASGTSTVMVLVSPGLASTVVPSANVMSCGIAPVLASFTSYLPAFGTDRSPGLKARSMASTSSVPRTSPLAGTKGWQIRHSGIGPAGAGAIPSPGPDGERGCREIGEVRGCEFAAHRIRRRAERIVDCAGSVNAARAAAQDATRRIAAVFHGVHDPEQVDVDRWFGQVIAAISARSPHDDPRTHEIRQHMWQEPARNVHVLGDPAGAHGGPVVQERNGERGAHGIVAAKSQFESHGPILGAEPAARKGRTARRQR